MLKHITISSLAVLRAATVLLALATGVFSSRADHFVWSDSNTGVYYSDPPGDYDDVYQWDNTSYASESEWVGGSTFDWYGYVQSESLVETLEPTGPIHTGHTLATYAEAISEITGEWVSDEDGPPVDATVDYAAQVSGTVYGQTWVWQYLYPTGDFNWFIAGANADALCVLYPIDYNPLLDAYINFGGGITNGLPNSGIGGGVQDANMDIEPVDYDIEHITEPDEEWIWTQTVDFSLDVSDSYTVDVDDVWLEPDIIAWTSANLLLNSNGPNVGAIADSQLSFYATFSYTVTPNY